MKRSLISFCAAAIAAPLIFAAAPVAAQGFSLEFGPGGPRVGFYTEGSRPYYNGYRGYRDRRSGYRYYNGYWFPRNAFVDRRHTSSIRDRDRRHHQRRDFGRAHFQWCADQYRSYRASDNTFQPYDGPRRQCNSPYN